MKSMIVILIIIAAVLVCIGTGCLIFKRKSADPVPLTARPQGKIAIVYYSQSKVRNTALIAKWIQRNVGGDLLELEMAEPYPEPYGETLKAASKDVSADRHPPLKSIPDLSGYDIVFLGSPIWYGTYAPPMATFLDADKLAGKTVAPFCTHGGGGEGRCFADIKKACPEAKILPGLVIRGSNQVERRLGIGVPSHHTENDVITWLNGLFPPIEAQAADGKQQK